MTGHLYAFNIEPDVIKTAGRWYKFDGCVRGYRAAEFPHCAMTSIPP